MWYIGETSRSTYERLTEHMWLFSKRKDGDPSKNEASSALWLHSREAHGGEMVEGDWRSSIISSHTKTLNRQVTEAVLISERGGGKERGGRTVRLLNSKLEFGANLILEVVVMRGEEVLGQRNNKRRRGFQQAGGGGRENNARTEEDREEESSRRLDGAAEEEEEAVPDTTIPPPTKRRRRQLVEVMEGAEEAPMNFSELTLGGMRKEMRRRRLKPGNKGREEMICELQRESRSQRRIQWRMGGGTGP